MKQELEELLIANGNGYVFSEDGGETPVAEFRVRRGLERALERIEINHDERLKRNLSFHAWRYFFNTLLRMSNVADSKVQSLTGHRSMSMTEHYIHFDTRQFTEVRVVQAELLAFKKNEITDGEDRQGEKKATA
jgi:integrase